jgi:cytochrome c oxidase cbb3-type subunit 1
MERVIVWYLRMSVIYFVLGVVIGFALLLWPDEALYYIPVHVHLNLLGFMSMMIYGVGYHILPKFSGAFIHSPRIMNIQFWIANAGLIGMAISWPFMLRGETGAPLIVSSLLTMVAVVLFAYNMLKTIKPA